MNLFRKQTTAPPSCGTLGGVDSVLDPPDTVAYCAGRVRGFEERYGLTTPEFVGLSYEDACERAIAKLDRHVWAALAEDLDRWGVEIGDLSRYPVVRSAPVLTAAH